MADEHAPAVLQLIKVLPALKILDLSGNAFSAAKRKALREAAAANPKLVLRL